MTQDKELLRRLKISQTLKGRSPWNKGKTANDDARINKLKFWSGKKMSDETKLKMSIIRKGIKLSDKAKENIRKAKIGKLNPMYGKKQSLEQIEARVSKIRGIHHWWLTGELNPNWKGGITLHGQGLRRTVEFSKWRKAVFQRDNWTCLNCGLRDGRIHPHHIKEFAYYPESRFDVDNGVTLCVKCHKAIHAIGSIKWGELGGSPKG